VAEAVSVFQNSRKNQPTIPIITPISLHPLPHTPIRIPCLQFTVNIDKAKNLVNFHDSKISGLADSMKILSIRMQNLRKAQGAILKIDAEKTQPDLEKNKQSEV
jgi:hypothetical protein